MQPLGGLRRAIAMFNALIALLSVMQGHHLPGSGSLFIRFDTAPVDRQVIFLEITERGPITRLE